MRGAVLRAGAGLACGLLLGACGSEEAPATAPESQAVGVEAPAIVASPAFSLDPALEAPTQALMLAYLERVEQDFAELDESLMALQQQVESFLEAPELASMNAARDSWLRAHRAYQITTLHRYTGASIFSEQRSLRLYELNYRIDHWPILAGYIDYFAGYLESGIVNDINVNLELTTLREQHGTFDLAEASVGFHVMEFLLWGENPEGLSPRPASDYVQALTLSPAQLESGMLLEQLPNNRRRQLLGLLVAALREDIEASREVWRQGGEDFRSEIGGKKGAELLLLLLEASAGMLTEELLVRSLYPLLNENLEESIHSPYSHSTAEAVSAQLFAIERLMRAGDANGQGNSLYSILAGLSDDFDPGFFQNLDASRECLDPLYGKLEESASSAAVSDAEFEIVDCINLLTNAIDSLEQIKVKL